MSDYAHPRPPQLRLLLVALGMKQWRRDHGPIVPSSDFPVVSLVSWRRRLSRPFSSPPIPKRLRRGRRRCPRTKHPRKAVDAGGFSRLPSEDVPARFVPLHPRSVEDQKLIESVRDFSTARAHEEKREWDRLDRASRSGAQARARIGRDPEAIELSLLRDG